MSSEWSIKEGDSRPALERRLKHNGKSLDLTSATGVLFRWKKSGGDTREKAATIVDAEHGRVRVDLSAVDTTPAGTYDCELVVTYSDGSEQTGPSRGYFQIIVAPRLS